MIAEFSQQEDGRWLWNIVALNGRVMATSGKSFGRKSHCKDSLKEVLDRVRNSELTVMEVEFVDWEDEVL
jgi:uncharacterized protein YegP (UPF0339 family)